MRGLAAVVLAAALLGLLVEHGVASDGGTRVIVGDEQVGPYQLFFIAAPEPAHAGTTVTYIARMKIAASGERVTDARVTLELSDPASGKVVSGEATHLEPDNQVDFAARIEMPEEGEWSGRLHIEGPAGPLDVPFTQTVVAQQSSLTLAALGIPFLVILAGLGIFWLVRARGPAATQAQ